jgi:glycosyltransferase involved in cell wall biosynthesis
MRYCVIIPTFNNEKTLREVISGVLSVTPDIIIVSDGSTDNTELILKEFNFLKTISYSPNRGKGYAIREGFKAAMAAGYQYAITIDSDGQHYPADIEVFLKKASEVPDSIIVGARILDPEKVSKGSRFANRISNFWYTVLTGIKLPDTQTGFRLYPLDLVGGTRYFTDKYEFELEILVRAAWRRINVTSAPIQVYYPPREERISHFRPFKDFARISLLNTILFLIAFLYVKPFSFVKYLTKENVREFINKNILLTRDSNLKISLAVALGIFTGILPVWGFQLFLAIVLAHLFRLSKLITAVAANISIPPMIPILLYLSYLTGGFVLGTGSNIRFSANLTVKSFETNLIQYIVGSIVLSVIMSIAIGIISFLLLKIFRRGNVVKG